MNVLDLPGPEFLQFYFLLLAFVTIGGVLLRFMLRGPGGEIPQFASHLDPYEIAYLAGGPRGTVDAAMAGLVHSGAVTVSKGGAKLLAGSPLPADAAPLSREIHRRISSGNGRISNLRRQARSLADGLAGRLRAMNVALMPGQARLVRFLPAALVGSVLLLGIAKINVGLSRHRPVSYLTMLCMLTGFITMVFAMKPSWRTRAGDRLLQQLRDRNAALRATATSAPQNLADADVAMALALFGPSVLATGALLDLKYALWPPSSSGAGCSGGSGCGGGGCGGGGCGGGGCGGGCGGCGG